MAIQVEQITKADVPKTQGGGRSRVPSEFDELIQSSYDAWKSNPETAWFRTTYDGTDVAFDALKSELDRAASHAGKGKATRKGEVKDEATGEVTHYFVFQIRDKAKNGPRGPRKPKVDANAESANGTANGTQESPPSAEESPGNRRRPRRDAVNA